MLLNSVGEISLTCYFFLLLSVIKSMSCLKIFCVWIHNLREKETLNSFLSCMVFDWAKTVFGSNMVSFILYAFQCRLVSTSVLYWYRYPSNYINSFMWFNLTFTVIKSLWCSQNGKFSYGYASSPGKRSSMEDFYDTRIDGVDGEVVGLFGVFDGLSLSLSLPPPSLSLHTYTLSWYALTTKAKEYGKMCLSMY